jgi:hypothetical protein
MTIFERGVQRKLGSLHNTSFVSDVSRLTSQV